jgi:LysM repeat protein
LKSSVFQTLFEEYLKFFNPAKSLSRSEFMATNIGIKIANGEFYPVLEEGVAAKKRLILTTVHDNQESVQIDLYKSASNSMADASYIGSLIVEHIAPKPKGEPSIELIVASKGTDELVAEATDLDSTDENEQHQLTVSLQALNEETTYDMPDFELESLEHPPQGLYEKASAIRESSQHHSFPWKTVLITVFILIVLALAGWYFFSHYPQSKEAIASSVTTETETKPQQEVEPSTITTPEKPSIAAPAPTESTSTEDKSIDQQKPSTQSISTGTAQRKRPPAPVASYKVPSTIPPGGVQYKIRWGDTLWDISEAFYRNPWLYPGIARFNNIRDPDYIIAGTYIRIPPKK